jgi:acetyltransferase-like isoleucine patch superfamily enzyme
MNYIKSLLWFLASPIRRRAWLTSPRLRGFAKCLHRSTRVLSADAISWHDSIKIGRNTQIDVGKSSIAIKLAENAWIGDDCELATSGLIIIGFGTSIQHRSILIGDIDIGSGCIFAADIYISSYSHRFEDFPAWPIRWQDEYAGLNRSTEELSRPVKVGEDCWLGKNVIVMPGVEIGRGAVIGANSVVTRDIPAYAVAVGAPAKVIRRRLNFFPPPEITATNEIHIPYFYRGFQMWRNNSHLFGKLPNHFGWYANSEFELMLSLEGAKKIRLFMDITESVCINAGAGDVVMSVLEKYVDVPCVAIPLRSIKVKWSPKNATSKNVLVCVKSAKLLK